MALFMDIHTVDGASAQDVARAHLADVAVQDRYAVEYLKYWFNEGCGKLFCLVEAPSAEAARCVHEEAHGMVAEKLIEVDPDLIDGFMGRSEINDVGAALLAEAGARQHDTGIRTIMFTDVVGSTELTSLLGDDAVMSLLTVHDRIVRDALRANAGREIKHTGDGIMAAFVSAAAAVRCACEIQRGLADHNVDADHPVTVRVGLTAGEPVESHDDLFGSTVQLAARLCAQAAPGQILVSNVVADLCIGKGLHFDDAGEAHLKGFDGPIPTRAVQLTC